ncbi:hypothetical protein KKG08_01255 [Patescibacteria group bacterium]|nr:hypothetical protein [Patescibacteria group bacterium]
MKLLGFIKRYVFPVFIVCVSIYICFKNYTIGTFLTGWDTLHPEFNFGLYWKRILDSVWQEHQGLGAVASQAHASEIIRVVILQFFNLFLKVNQIRYAYVFLMLIIGPLGVYFFLEYLLGKKNKGVVHNIVSLIGSLLYLLNLGTLQNFYVPLEMFLTHFGFLGWVFLYGTKYFDSGKKKELFFFLLFNILITPQAHTATLFYTYLMMLILYFGVLTLLKGHIKDILRMLVIVLLVNSFWMLPNFYYAFTRGREVPESKIHHLFSNEAFLANKRFGNIKDAALLKSFLFDWGEHVGDERYGQLLDEWQVHLKNPFVTEIGYVYFALVVLGAILSFFKKNEYGIGFFVLLLVCYFFLFATNPPFGFLFIFFQKHIPLFEEVFRFPFTKFSIILSLSYAFFFSLFLLWVFERISNLCKLELLKVMCLLLLTMAALGSLYYYMNPAFKGKLISPSMRVNIPGRYFEMFKYFDSQDEYGRVVNLPVQSYWGWIYNSWNEKELGYQGAGFLWFGIKQPLLNREFDRWNLKNEQQYREFSHAIYSENVPLLENVLEKYKTRWLVLDESVIEPGADETLLFYPQIESLLSSSERISLEKDFGEGLSVYKYSPKVEFTETEKLDKFDIFSNDIFKEYLDPIYLQIGNYIVEEGGASYSFVGISQLNENINPEIIRSSDREVHLVSKIAGNVGEQSIVPVEILAKYSEPQLDIRFYSKDFGLNESRSIFVGEGKSFLIVINGSPFYIGSKVSGEFTSLGYLNIKGGGLNEIDVYNIVDRNILAKFNYYPTLEVCGDVTGDSSYSLEKIENGFSLLSRDALACVTAPLTSFWKGVTTKGFLLLSYSGGVKPNDVCIFDSEIDSCIDFYLENENRQVALLEGGIDRYFLRFYSDAIGRVEEVNKIYKDISVDVLGRVHSSLITFEIEGQNIVLDTLVFPKTDYLSGNVVDLKGYPRVCSNSKDFPGGYSIEKTDNSIIYISSLTSLCDTFQFLSVDHSIGYVLEIKARNIQGLPLRICLTNEYSKRCDIDVLLPRNENMTSAFYMISPMGKGKGYTINLSNTVFGEETSINELEYISLVPISYDLITSLKSSLPSSENSEVQKLFVLNEAYDIGWLAFCGNNLCNARHVEVNNWSNGWVFDGDIPDNVKIIFWPQYLQYFGYFLLVLGLFVATTSKKDREI